MDVLIVGLMSLANAYIKILGCRLANLGQLKFYQQKSRNKLIYEDLRRNIDFHKQILAYIAFMFLFVLAFYSSNSNVIGSSGKLKTFFKDPFSSKRDAR